MLEIIRVTNGISRYPAAPKIPSVNSVLFTELLNRIDITISETISIIAKVSKKISGPVEQLLGF